MAWVASFCWMSQITHVDVPINISSKSRQLVSPVSGEREDFMSAPTFQWIRAHQQNTNALRVCQQQQPTPGALVLVPSPITQHQLIRTAYFLWAGCSTGLKPSCAYQPTNTNPLWRLLKGQCVLINTALNRGNQFTGKPVLLPQSYILTEAFQRGGSARMSCLLTSICLSSFNVHVTVKMCFVVAFHQVILRTDRTPRRGNRLLHRHVSNNNKYFWKILTISPV